MQFEVFSFQIIWRIDSQLFDANGKIDGNATVKYCSIPRNMLDVDEQVFAFLTNGETCDVGRLFTHCQDFFAEIR